MITVVTCTHDDAPTIAACLESLFAQEGGVAFESVVLDDASSDGTPEVVAGRFPRVRVVREDRRCGWVELLRRHAAELRGDAVAFLGAHCRARPGWLPAVAAEVDAGAQVVSGMGHHGDGRLLERFEAISVHPDYVGETPGEVAVAWDDNFAIRAELLAAALPDTRAVLSDGAGATLLSRCLRALGIPIFYRPSMAVDHATNSLGRIVATWYGEMAHNAVILRRIDPTLPGAGLLRLGPLVAVPITGGRWFQGIRAMARARKSLGISVAELAFHAGLLTGLMAPYFLGLCRELLSARRHRAILAGSPRSGTESA